MKYLHLPIFNFQLSIFHFLAFALLSTSTVAQTVETSKFAKYVNVFTGTGGLGNTYPGAVVPFGMVQLSPDNGLPGWDRISGYFEKDSTIAGFSHIHLTGTGAGDGYDVLVFPSNSRFGGNLWPELPDYRPYSKFRHSTEKAWPGYYKVDLESSGIKAELTTTERVGFHRYTFPKDDSSQIAIDLGYALNWDGATDTYLEVVDSVTVKGYRKSSGWAADQRVYFVAKFSKPFYKADLFEGNKPANSKTAHAAKTKIKLWFATPKTTEVLVKVALSSVSAEGALLNLTTELPDWNFKAHCDKALKKWDKQLSQIEVKGSEEKKKLFYTNLYHCFLTPSVFSDVDGQSKGADGKIHANKGFTRYSTFSLWDTYRATHPLYTLLAPQAVQDFVQTFLAHADEIGLLPVWELWGNETNMMIGYHAVPVIVDAYFKGIKMDAEKAFAACKKSAMDKGRSIEEYMDLGYVPADGKEKGNWSVSKTLEYAYDDWCIAEFAKALGKTDDYAYFAKRANNWINHFDKSSGFFRPKKKDGSFVSPFTPKQYTEYFCESNAWQYFWHVQHDITGLINTLGKPAFTARLDSMFSYYPEKTDTLPIFSTGMIGQYAHGNEPVHHVAYLFNYVGKPWRTQELIRKIITEQYNTTSKGFCGNEDCGQMSAWLVMSAMGIYPVNPAVGIYDLTSPYFDEVIINSGNGKRFIIKTQKQSAKSIYIKSVKLNGLPLNSLQLKHADIINGGQLEFQLTDYIAAIR
jgi:predicted alpha-1,2-mannosidase